MSVANSVEPIRPRGRGLGIPFQGEPGPLNSLTDVHGIEVGHVTIISGMDEQVARTGVTAISPLGKETDISVPAAWYSLNGNGEMTGTSWVEESGFLEGPIILTNTFSVGLARDAVIEWGLKHFPNSDHFSLPVVAETYDGRLNDISGFHVRKDHIFAALDGASTGPIAEGNVGGGTGMVAFQFKGGIGTASRLVNILGQAFTMGVLVQANFGIRLQLTIAGVPVGLLIPDLLPQLATAHKDGSVIVIVATDAPLLPHQIRRVVKRAALGLARTGGVAMNSSGDLFLGFTVSAPKADDRDLQHWSFLPNAKMDPLFTAAAEATEEAIVNALIAAETMTGINGNTVYALPHDRVREILFNHNRLARC